MSITKRGAAYEVGAWCIRRDVLAALGVAAFIEVVGIATGTPPMLWVGSIAIYWSALPCLAALVLAFRPPLLPRIDLRDPREFAFSGLLLALVTFAVTYAFRRGVEETSALLVAVAIEEAVYRVALPAILVLVALRLGVDKRVAWAAAILVSMILFAAMPGHQEQLNNGVDYASLVAFTLLMSHAVWRGRSLFAPIAAHAIYDYATIGMNMGYISHELRLVGAAAALIALGIVGAHPKIGEATKVPDVVVAAPEGLIIDLRESDDGAAPGPALERRLEAQS